MGYIWECDRWPQFEYDSEQVSSELACFESVRDYADRIFSLMGKDAMQSIQIKAFSAEAISSSFIEGMNLHANSVYSSVAKRLDVDLQLKGKTDEYAFKVSEVVLDAVLNHGPMTDQRLFEWNTKLIKGSYQVKKTSYGSFRSGQVWVISGNRVGDETVEYEGLPPERIQHDMNVFLDWLNGENEKSPIVKSAIASFWFVAIHPFADGNGRISRAIADYVLYKMDETGRFKYFSISNAIEKNRNLYYGYLKLIQSQSNSMDVTKWILWYLDMATSAIRDSVSEFERTIRLTNLMNSDVMRGLNNREHDIMYRLLSGSFFGKLTSEKYRKIEKCESATATRDLSSLVKVGLLERSEDGGRSTYYKLAKNIESIL